MVFAQSAFHIALKPGKDKYMKKVEKIVKPNLQNRYASEKENIVRPNIKETYSLIDG